jgi:hypothetical protein
VDQPPKTEKEIREERWRQRWNAFWTPFITLTAVVSSVAMLMVLIQTCQQRNLPVPLLPPTSPLNRPGAVKPLGPDPDDRVRERGMIPAPTPDRQDDGPSSAR